MKCSKVVLSSIVMAACVLTVSAFDCVLDSNKIPKSSVTLASPATSDADCEATCIAGYKNPVSTKPCEFDVTTCLAASNLFDEGASPSQKCSCMAGYKRDAEGDCVFDDTLCKAEANAEVKVTGTISSCGCKDKFNRLKNGKCEAVKTDLSYNYTTTHKVANAKGDGWECMRGYKPTTGGDACEKMDPLTNAECDRLGRKFDGTCKTECKEATHKPAKGHPVGRCYPKADNCEKDNREKIEDLCLCKAGFIAQKDDTFGVDEACVSGAVMSMILSTSAVLVSVVGAVALLM